MRFLFASVLLLACAIAGMAAAESAESLAVQEKILQSGSVEYAPTAEELEEMKDDPGYARDAGGMLACNANVRYPEIRASFRFTDYVNQRFRQLAELSQCDRTLAAASLEPKVTFFQGPIVSVMFHDVLYVQGGNGSCHGNWKYMVFDLDTGKEFRLSDLIYAKDFPELKAAIVRHFAAEGISAKTIENLLDEKFWSLGFYIADGKVFVDMDDFLRSCAEGNHYPVEIPAKFLHETDENRSLLRILSGKPLPP